MVEPQTGLALFNAIATAGKTIYEIAQGASKVEEKQRLMGVYDMLMNLKRDAADLEDQIRDLSIKLRFKSDDFEFKNPFWYEKSHPDRPLCAKCFAGETIGPMGEEERIGSSGARYTRMCLACRIPMHYGPKNPIRATPDFDGSPWS
jgi:hypothetical protein